MTGAGLPVESSGTDTPPSTEAKTSSIVAGRDLLALIIAAGCWGLGTVISKAALDEIPPLTLLPIQLASSLVVLALLMKRQGVPFRGGPRLLGRLGLLNPGIAYALSLVGLVTVTASLSVLLWALEPLMILFLAAFFLRERITPALVALSLVAVAGMVLVVYDPASSGQAIGVALTLAGIACCAAYTVITRRFIPEARETSQVDPRAAGPRAWSGAGPHRHRRARRRRDRACHADPARSRECRRLGRPVLRRRLLVLPRRASQRPCLDRGCVVLSDPYRRRRGERLAPRRAPRRSPVGRCRHRARRTARHPAPARGGVSVDSPERSRAGDATGDPLTGVTEDCFWSISRPSQPDT